MRGTEEEAGVQFATLVGVAGVMMEVLLLLLLLLVVVVSLLWWWGRLFQRWADLTSFACAGP